MRNSESPSRFGQRARRVSRRRALGFGCAFLAAGACATRADAQQQAQGFQAERFYPSAPGGGWFVMDDLHMYGGLGGVVESTSGYSHGALRVTDGVRHLAVVSDTAFTDFGFAITYDRWRVYLNFTVPLLIAGEGGVVGNYLFTAPGAAPAGTSSSSVLAGPPAPSRSSVDLGSNPDTLTDARIGFDARRKGGGVRPGKAGPKGVRCDELIKFGKSSSGCETRPAKGRARPTGSEACAGPGNGSGDA